MLKSPIVNELINGTYMLIKSILGILFADQFVLNFLGNLLLNFNTLIDHKLIVLSNESISYIIPIFSKPFASKHL